MKHSEAGFYAHVRARLVIYPQPPNAVAGRIIGALRADRLADAIRYARELPCHSPVEQAWNGYLKSRIHLESGEYAAAKAAALKSASAALALIFESPQDQSLLSLASAALESEGTALRRQEQYVQAARIHHTALDLRRSDETPEGQMESTLSLAACAGWMNDAAGAEAWYQSAIGLDALGTDAALFKSWAMIRFSAWLTMKCRHEEALTLAHAAQRLLQQFMPGELATACAGLSAVDALISRAEAIHVDAPEGSLALMDQASRLLETLIDELSAFAPVAHADLVWCKERQEFLRRLRQTLEVVPAEAKRA